MTHSFKPEVVGQDSAGNSGSRADASNPETAAERATSIVETLLKLEPPKGESMKQVFDA